MKIPSERLKWNGAFLTFITYRRFSFSFFFPEDFDMTNELWYHALVFLDKYRQELPQKDEFYEHNDVSGKNNQSSFFTGESLI